MKEMNRREFLTLTGAAVVALSLAGCGGPSAPPAPAAPTGKEAKVLEAIKKYRAAAGVKEPLALDNGLKSAAELVVKIAKGEMKFDEEAMKALAKAEVGYDGVCAPIGIAFDKDTGNMMPVCVYSEDAEKMAQNLSLQLDEGAKASLSSPAITLVNIKTFELSGVTYWVALIAESKK
ncbi:MAG: twin-arginine translocation signal domain-containing protein [Faecalibacterium sp.]|nr:twin-arginine translocation signal domain-containing protein [Faecalibacterium sp.]